MRMNAVDERSMNGMVEGCPIRANLSNLAGRAKVSSIQVNRCWKSEGVDLSSLLEEQMEERRR